jgi:hypothetical protein
MLILAKNKRVNFIIIPLILMMVGVIFIPHIPVKAEGSAIMRLSSNSTDYEIGDTIYIDIWVEPNQADLNVVRSIMDFSGGDVILIEDFNLGSSFPYPSPGLILDNQNNQINVGGFVLSGSVSNNFLFGTLIFQANQTGTTTINFSVGSHLISIDQTEQINLADCQGITINVSEPEPEEPEVESNYAPIFMPVSNKSIVLDEAVNFQVLATDPDNDIVDLTWDIPAGSLFINVSSGTTAKGDFSWVPSSLGTYTAKFYAHDNDIDDPKTSIFNVIIIVSESEPDEPDEPDEPEEEINTAPVFEQINNKNILLGESINFEVIATDLDNDNVSLTWQIPENAIFDNVTTGLTASGNFSWIPEEEGNYNLIFTATDDSLLGFKTRILNVNINVAVPPILPNHAPEFDIVLEKSVNAGETLIFNVTATDPDDDTVSLRLVALENAYFDIITTGSTSTGRFSWQPENFGIYYALFEASDNNLDNPLTRNMSVRIIVFGGECPPCGGGACPICQCEKQDSTIPVIEEKETPDINSPTHPNQDNWYANNKPQFSWQVADMGQGYYLNLDENPYTDLDNAYFYNQENFFSFSEVADGFWYFHVRVKYSDGWGPAAHYQVKIDTISPDFFRPSIEGNELYFSALDIHSGIAYYDMKIDQGNWQRVESPLNLDEFINQGDSLILRAIDNAGNAIESYVDLAKKEVLVKEEQKTYVLEEFINIIEPPLIEKVSFEQKRDKLFRQDFLVVSGTAAPNAQITIYLSTKPESIFSTQADKRGNWEARYEKELEVQKYSIYATASIDEINSMPSDKVYFTLLEKFVPQKTKDISNLGYVLAVIILASLLFALWKLKKYINKIIKKRMNN